MKWKVWIFDDEGRRPEPIGTWSLDEALTMAVTWVELNAQGLDLDGVRSDLERVGGRIYEGHHFTIALVSVE